ncbi:MAG TPA: site-specific integrase [Steroidobacteraceae bacterium]|nr:site-specific integrase [Steroidobacteraceae bacterium]
MATVRKHRGNWVADYRDQWGKRHRERPGGTFENRALQKMAAQELLTKRLGEVDKATFHPETRHRTFGDLCDHFLTNWIFRSDTTKSEYDSSIECYLRPYFGGQKLQSVKVEHVDTFRKALTEGYPAPILEALAKRVRTDKLARARAVQKRTRLSNATINKHTRHLHLLFEYACERRWVDYNPVTCRALATAKRKVVLSVEETQRVIAELQGAPRDERGVLMAPSPHWSLLIRVAIVTGMRQGEILGLQWHDLHPTNAALYVSRTWKKGAYRPPKTENGYRWVEVPTPLMDELRRWQTELRNIGIAVEGHCPIFPTRRGKAHSHANLLQRGWYPALKRAGIYDSKSKVGKAVRFHDLRRTAVSLMRDLGVTEGDVSATMGHSIAVMRAVYSHPLPKDRRGGTDAIAAALAKDAG